MNRENGNNPLSHVWDKLLLATESAGSEVKTSMLLVALYIFCYVILIGFLGIRVVSMLDLGAEKPGFKSQSRRCRVTVLGKLLTPTVPLFTKQQNW